MSNNESRLRNPYGKERQATSINATGKIHIAGFNMMVSVHAVINGTTTVIIELRLKTEFKVGPADVSMSAYGRLKLPCEHMGDLYLSGAGSISNTGVGFLEGAGGYIIFKSNCGEDFWLRAGLILGEA